MATITSTIDSLTLTLQGKTPLVLNNIRGADPDEPIVRQIKEITDKGKRMTAEDRERLEHLKWLCSMYEQDEGYIMLPTINVLRSFQRAASVFRKGTAMDRAVSPRQQAARVLHDGPTKFSDLYANPRYRLRNMVNSNPSGKKAMVPTVRPIFPVWSLTMDIMLINDVVGREEFARIAGLAGEAEGVGNARRLGYGRFDITIT